MPTGWETERDVAGALLSCTQPPPTGDRPTYLPPSILVTFDKLPDGTTFDSWLQDYRQSLVEFYDRLRLIDTEEIALGDVAAFRTLSHYLHQVVGGVCTDQWCIEGQRRVYVITCSSGALQYDDFADTFARVASGFSVTAR